MTTSGPEDTTTTQAPEQTGPEPYTGPDPAYVHHPTPDHVLPFRVREDRKYTRRFWYIVTVAVVAVIALAGAVVVALSIPVPAFTTRGTLTVSQSTLNSGGLTLSEAYPDISDGSQVEVVNPSGAVVGVGTLSQAPVPRGQLAIDSLDMSTSEYFTFTATGIPSGLARYGIKVGHDRGTVWESERAMRAGVDLNLG